MTRPILFTYLAVFLTTVLGGCSTGQILKSTEPPGVTYNLHAGEVQTDIPTGAARIVEIAKPAVPPGFETERIALYLDGGQKLDYYAGSKWPDILDNVLQDFTRRSLTGILPYTVAINPSQSVKADYRLQVKVNEFQPVYDTGATGNPRVRVSMEFTLIRLPEERIVTNFTLTKEDAVADNRLDLITAALESMARQIQKQAFVKMDSYLR